eukprot:jgi/Chrzof1/14508/Cz09g05130.t1
MPCFEIVRIDLNALCLIPLGGKCGWHKLILGLLLQLNDCGPVHITIGDAGNAEGTYKDFIDSVASSTSYCLNPEARSFPSYQPQRCFSYQNGEYCFTKQPEWSAYREPSFGHGTLDVLNATHAQWSWYKNQWPEGSVADTVTIIRNTNCGTASK